MIWGCSEQAKAPPPPPAATPPEAPASGPASKPGSASSMPAGHDTSSTAVSLEDLFKMPETPDVVVEVGERKVPRAALEQILRQTQIQLSATGLPAGFDRPRILQGAVDQLVDEELRNILADELGVKADPGFEKQWLADLEARMEAQPSFKVFLLRAGKDRAQRERDAHRAAVMEAVVQKIKAGAKAETEAEAKDYYARHVADYTDRAGVEVWRIFVKAPRGMVQRDRDIARARAEDLLAKAKKDPKNFTNLAISYSEGGKATDGGFVGWVSPGTLAPDLEKQIEAAKPNTILPLWEDAVGFFVYKVGKRRDERVRPFDEVADEILEKVYRRSITKKVDAELARLKAAQAVKVHIPELEQK